MAPCSEPGEPAASPKLPPLVPWDEGRRRCSLAAAMAARPDAGPLWVFAYGSLIWNPCFPVAERRRARLPGHARRGCVWSVHARGTPARPGLFFALDRAPAEHCEGIALRVPPEAEADALTALWARELYAGVYHPAWRRVETGAGAVTALCFLANRDHPFYVAAMTPERMVAVIAAAAGRQGPAADYFRDTARALRAHGLADPRLEALIARIDRHIAAKGTALPEGG